MLQSAMAQTEQVYSARQLAGELGITLQMLSIYAKAYTKLTKQQISKQGRLGRHFTAAQREVIKNAREMVQQNTGITVDEAMRRALLFDADSLEAPVQVNGAQVDLAALKTAFSEALRQEVTAPLVAEIKALRQEVEDLKQGRELPSSHNPAPEIKNAAPVGTGNRPHSLLVQVVLKIESWVRR